MEDPTSPRPKAPRNFRLFVVALTTIGHAVFAVAYTVLAVDARTAFPNPSTHVTIVVAGLLGAILPVVATGVRLLNERKKLEVTLEGKERDIVDIRHQLADSDAERRESDTIIGAIPSNMLVVDQSLLVQGRYSAGLPALLQQEELAGQNFLNILQRLLSDRMFRTSRDYLQLLFDPSKKERTISKINPLDEVEMHVGTGPDRTVRYLSFAFRRIIEAGTITRSLVTVEDITERVLRERALRESERQNLKQFEMLIGILHVPAHALDDFVAVAKEQLAIANEALRAQDFASATLGQTALLQQRLDDVMRAIHNVKGNASLLHLEHFERKASAYEAKILDFRNRPALGGEDFLALVIEQADFRTDLDDLQTLRVKLAGLQRSATIAEQSGDDLITSVGSLAKSIASRQFKDVRVDAEGFDSRGLSPGLRGVLRDVLIQLTRNSISHGIESKAEREAAGKSKTGKITIHPLEPAAPGTFGFVFRDDGRGLDPGTIRRRAVELGLVDAESASDIDDSEIAGFIFSPGFTTGAVGDDAGRGMGMNVIKKRIVDEVGGEIAMNSEVGKFCEFTFVIPTSQYAHA